MKVWYLRAVVLVLTAIVVLRLHAGSMSANRVASATLAPVTFSHIIVIMLENQTYSHLMGNTNAPYINKVLVPTYASATAMYAPSHFSLSGYLALSSGRTYYTSSDGGPFTSPCPSLTCSTSDLSLFEQLTDNGRSWKVYSEDQQTPCQTTYTGMYSFWHNPALYYQHLGPNSYIATGNGTCQSDDVPYSHLPADLAAGTLPDFAFLVPNNCDNMHSSCSPLNNQVAQGDTWLDNQLSGNATVPGGLIGWAQAHDTLLVVTFDEAASTDTSTCCPYAATGGGGHIAAWVIGPTAKVKAGGYQSTVGYNLYSIFKTLQDNWALPLLYHANDSTVQDLSDFFLTSTSSPPAATPTSSPPVATAAAILLKPTSGVKGQTVAVTGTKFGISESVKVYWSKIGTTYLISTTTNTTGGFSGSFSVPSATFGPHTIIAVGQTSGISATATFQVLPETSLKYTSGSAGSTDVEYGAGFAADEFLTAYWEPVGTSGCRLSSSALQLGTTTSSSVGAFYGATAITFTVPAAISGTYTIVTIGKISGASGACATSTYTLKTSLSVTPASGTPGSTATVSGRGYGANEQVQVRWGCWTSSCSGALLGTATTDATGSFSGLSVTIPATATVSTTATRIGGLGLTSHDFAMTPYTVT